MTTWFRNRIKKLWLYILFPLFIYSTPVLYLSFNKKIFIYTIMVLLIIYIYFTIKLFRGLSIRDALLTPLLVLILLIIVIVMSLNEG